MSEVAATWPGWAWRWGVLVPCVVAALGGGIGDVVTGTLRFWWLLAPSYAYRDHRLARHGQSGGGGLAGAGAG